MYFEVFENFYKAIDFNQVLIKRDHEMAFEIYDLFTCICFCYLRSQDYDLASHTAYVVSINFTHKWRDLQFKVSKTPNNRFLRNFFISS